MTEASIDELGPIDYIVVEFPGNQMTGEGLPILVDLVDRGVIRIIDLVFFTKGDDGSVALVEIADFDGDGELDLAIFEGATSGVVGEDDVQEAAAAVEAGSSAALLVYENRWAAPFAAAVRRGGGQLVAGAGGGRCGPGGGGSAGHHVDYVLPADDASDVGTCDRCRCFRGARSGRVVSPPEWGANPSRRLDPLLWFTE